MTIVSYPISQNGIDIFDLRMFKGYDLAYANSLKNNLSISNLNTYLYILIPLDFIYPFCLSFFFFLFFKKVTHHLIISLLGFLSMIFDYLENTLIIHMLTSDSLTERLVNLSSLFTQIKGYAYLMNYTLLLILLCVYLYKGYKIKRVN
jgi:hypothetical protein